MTVLQFLITKGQQTYAPYKSTIAHQFGGKRVRVKLLTVDLFQRWREADPTAEEPVTAIQPAFPYIPLRLDMVGMTTNSGTSFQTNTCGIDTNTAGFVANPTGLNIFIANKTGVTDFHGEVQFEGFCVGNWFQMSLTYAVFTPTYEDESVDIATQDGYGLQSCIVTIDVQEI